MKRGLVVLDHDEISAAEWAARADRAREALAAEGIDLGLIYGDVFQSDDIYWLTNLCLYWNESILGIPVGAGAGEPALLTKLSPRVQPWMRRTSTLTDLRSGKTFTALLAGLLEGRTPGTLGLVDAQLWPQAVIDEVSAAAPGWTVRPLGGVVRALRARPSEAELTLFRRGGAVLANAVAAATEGDRSDGARAGIAERFVRDAGFTDAIVRAVDGAVEITGQYRTSWLRVGRGKATAALRAAVGLAADGVTVGELAEAVQPWDLRVIDQVDLSTNGEYATHKPDRMLTTGDVVVISVETPEAIGASDTVVIGPAGAEVLTAQEVRS